MEDTLRIKLQVEGEEFHQQMRDAKDEIKDVGKSTKDFSSSLGRISPALGKMASSFKEAFSGIKGGMAGVKDTMASMKDGATGMAGIASAAKGLVTSLAPALAVVAAVVAAIMALQKAWEFLKKAFKAWDPTGYAKVFGTLQREIRKLMTALGALTSGAVKEIMYVVIGIVRWLRQGIEILVKIKSWVDGIVNSLGGAFDIIMNAVSILGGVFGVVFKIASDTGKQAAEEVGEVWSEEMSVGLASFDKLNNIGMEYGDAEEREELLKDIEVATTEGESLFDKITESLGGLLDILGEIGDTIGDLWGGLTDWLGIMTTAVGALWDDFTDWGRDALANIANGIGDWLRIMTTAVGALWDDFTEWAGDALANVIKFGETTMNTLGDLFGPLWDKFGSLASAAVSQFQRIFTDAINAIRSLIDSLISGLQSALDGIISGINSAAGAVKNLAVDSAASAASNVAKTNPSLFSKVVSGLSNTWKAITDPLTTVAKSATSNQTRTDFLSGVVQVSKGDFSGVLNGISETISNPGKALDNLAKFIRGSANGEVFAPNNPVLRWVGDNNRETEVAAPYSMIVSAVTTALNNMGVGTTTGGPTASNGPIDITLNIDGKKLTRLTYDYYENERIRRNGSGSY